MTPSKLYFTWEVRLDADVTRAQVREVFEFVEDDCELTIEAAPAAEEFTPAPFDMAALLQASAAPRRTCGADRYRRFDRGEPRSE
ncbi:MAG: hypothetical protein WDM79_04080 [Terricaulis sp.]